MLRRFQQAASAVALSLVLLGLHGCGGDTKVESIQDSPEVRKADDGGRKGMEDFMKSKGQSKSKARS